MPKRLLATVVCSRLAGAEVYQEAVFDAKQTRDVIYAQGLSCPNDQFSAEGCTAMDLKLDVWEPVQKSVGVVVPDAKPAYIMMHGGGNSGGGKGGTYFNQDWWTSRGFVIFDINYRVAPQKGLLPKESVTKQQLVTYSASNGSASSFSPHPTSGSGGSPYTGPLKLAPDPSDTCMSVDGTLVVLEACVSGSNIQQWHLKSFNAGKQSITHVATGYCLDIPSATENAADGLPLEVAPCDAAAGSDSTQTWQLGTGGALSVRAKSVDGSWPGPFAMFAKAKSLSALKWTPAWPSAYPAIRDGKAAIRWVRANAKKYGLDTTRMVASGGSAGATDMLAAGVTFEEEYKDELTVEEDPTLSSTNLGFSSAVQCLVLHWPSDGGITLAQEHNPHLRGRYRASNPPIISFHGDADTTISIERSYAVKEAYKFTGVAFRLHILAGCGHAAWCYNGNGQCKCDGGSSVTMEELAFPDVVNHLGLDVVGGDATV